MKVTRLKKERPQEKPLEQSGRLSVSESISVYWRHKALLGVFLLCAMVLIVRAIDLQVMKQSFLESQGEARQVRYVDVAAYRGDVYDRNGVPLAVSVPIHSVWVSPKVIVNHPESIRTLARLVKVEADELNRRVQHRKDKSFMYVKRHITPKQKAEIEVEALEGVYFQKEFKRYYPAHEVTAQLIGYTNIDGRGQEGIEKMMDERLAGFVGRKRVIKNRKGEIVGVEGVEKSAKPGEDVYLSVDFNIQKALYRALKKGYVESGAYSAAAVALDVNTGEVLAMASQPSFNPNNRKKLKPEAVRNRAVSDEFEPGSTMKPLAMAAALEAGAVKLTDEINTAPGYFEVSGFRIKDHVNLGKISPNTIIQKSSNVGIAKIAAKAGRENLWKLYDNLGFGYASAAQLPSERSGKLDYYTSWSEAQFATLSYGYGLSATLLQVARAHSVIANDGVMHTVSIEKREKAPQSELLIKPRVAQIVRFMMRSVVERGGTATKADVDGYAIAGKTGTVHKVERKGGYNEDSYRALFVSIAPEDKPRVVVAVMVDDPRGEKYSGGKIAAPIVADAMPAIMQALNVYPRDKTVREIKRVMQDSLSGGQHVAIAQ